MSSASTVHLIDDDEAVRDSLAFLLESAGLEIQTYDSAMAFLDRLGDVKAGCIVTDVRMPEIDGVELLRRLGDKSNSLPVIVITGHGDIPLAVEAMKLGAADFLEKPFDDESILAAVQTALARGQHGKAEDSRKSEIQSRIASLSGREQQVLRGLVAGHANKVIAFDLGISARTVEIYRANVMSKMEANSLPDLVRMALIAGVEA